MLCMRNILPKEYIKHLYTLLNFIHVHLRKNFGNYLEAKRMQIFPLNLQHQKVSSDFFKKKSVEAYECM